MIREVLLVGLAEEVGGWLRAEIDGLVVVAVDSLEDARAALAERAPGVLIVSERLAGGPGEELVQEARRAGAPGRIPILFCLASMSDPALGRRLVETHGIDQLLIFPLDRLELIRHVARFLGTEARNEPGAGGGTTAESEAAIWRRYREAVFARVEVLESAGVSLLEGNLGEATRRRAEREAHKLAGALGTFGFSSGSRLARKGEELLSGELGIEPRDVLLFTEIVLQLRTELERGERADRPSIELPELAPTILVLDADRDFSERIVFAAAACGINAIALDWPGEARAKLMGLRPEVVVIDASVDQHRSKYPLLQLLADVDPPIPAIVVGGKESLIDRTMALRLGARSFLRKPIAAAKVVAEAERILRRLRPQRGRVLVADDDPATLAALKAILVGAGLDVVTIADPLQVLSTLQAERFDLLILDREMPHLGGLELCRVLRSDPRWHSLPILILAEHRADIIHQIFDAGADDIVVRPIVDQELVTRVANRLERSRIYRNMSDTDLLTGLPNRWKAAEIIELLRRMAKRYLEPLSVAIIGIDDLRGIVERHGGAAGDEVICRLAELLVRTFRGEDVAGRWSDDRFVLALYGVGCEDSAARLRIALDEFQRIESRDGQGEVHHATFSVGIAVFPADGADLPALGHAAELALRTAEARGRGHIEAQVDETLASPGGQPIDVLIVEADEALTDLLTHTLEARGYRTLALLDGHDALTWLGPDSSAPGARVILMAVDLPGLDGLALLRRLKEMGITRTSRVIMLTARASEPEVLEALRAGAFDHVSKPFSVPVLMQRVSQALEV